MVFLKLNYMEFFFIAVAIHSVSKSGGYFNNHRLKFCYFRMQSSGI